MAQTGGILLNRVANLAGLIPYFMAIDKAKFRRVVKPGDQLRIEVEIINLRSRAVRLACKSFVDSSVASEAELLCMMTDQKAGA